MTAEVQRRRAAPGRGDVLRLPLLVVLGLLLGLWGALLVPTGPRLDGAVLSVGAALAVVGNLVAARVALRAVPRFGGVALLVGWAAVAVTLCFHRSNGSVVLPGTGDLAVPALVYVIGGLAAGGLAALVRTRP